MADKTSINEQQLTFNFHVDYAPAMTRSICTFKVPDAVNYVHYEREFVDCQILRFQTNAERAQQAERLGAVSFVLSYARSLSW